MADERDVQAGKGIFARCRNDNVAPDLAGHDHTGVLSCMTTARSLARLPPKPNIAQEW